MACDLPQPKIAPNRYGRDRAKRHVNQAKMISPDSENIYPDCGEMRLSPHATDCSSSPRRYSSTDQERVQCEAEHDRKNGLPNNSTDSRWPIGVTLALRRQIPCKPRPLSRGQDMGDTLKVPWTVQSSLGNETHN